MFKLDGLVPGMTLDNRYRIEAAIGRGGLGGLFRATDTVTSGEVAVRLFTSSSIEGERRSGFERQLQTAMKLHHPNLVPILDFGSDEGIEVSFVVMELLAGEDLAPRLSQRGRPPVPLALRILQEAAAGVGEGHRLGLVHGDVHPGNVFLARADRRMRARVLNFGVDRALRSAGATEAGATSPLIRYGSPEQLRGGPASAASDVFSLGVLGFELLAGLPQRWEAALAAIARGAAIRIPSLRDLNGEIPSVVADAIARALEVDPAARQPDAGALAAVLAEGLAAVEPLRPAAAPGPSSPPLGTVSPPQVAAPVGSAAPEVAAPAAAVESAAEPTVPVQDPAANVAPAGDPPLPAVAGTTAAGTQHAIEPAGPAVLRTAPPAAMPAPAAGADAPRTAVPLGSKAAAAGLEEALYFPPAHAVQPRTPDAAEEPSAVSLPLSSTTQPPNPVEAEARTLAAAPTAPAPGPRAAAVSSPAKSAVAVKAAATASAAPKAAAADSTAIRSGRALRFGARPERNRTPMIAAAAVVLLMVAGGITWAAVRPKSEIAAAALSVPTRKIALEQPTAPAAGSPQAAAAAPIAAAEVAPAAPPARGAPTEAGRKEEKKRADARKQAVAMLASRPVAAAQSMAPATPAQRKQEPAAPAPERVVQRPPEPVAERPVVQTAPTRAAAEEPASAVPSSTAVYEGGAVDERPSLTNTSEVQRALQRSYPARLRDKGVTGQVMVRFTVLRNGRVDPGSIKILESSDEAFSRVTSGILWRARFSAARINGTPVNAWVTMPISWTIAR